MMGSTFHRHHFHLKSMMTGSKVVVSLPKLFTMLCIEGVHSLTVFWDWRVILFL